MSRPRGAPALHIVLAAFLTAFLSTAFAQSEGEKADAGSADPFDITADHLEVLQDRNMALITGNVVIVRAGATLEADVVRAFFKDAEAQANSQIRTMEAEGDVSYDTGEERVTGRRALYQADAEIITFEDDVTVTRGRDVLNGCRLVYFLKERQSRLEACGSEDAPTGGRVRGVFFPDDALGEDAGPEAETDDDGS